MFSLEIEITVLGDAVDRRPAGKDRFQCVARHASRPICGRHQYDQQPNQVLCTLSPARLDNQRAGVEPVRPGAQLRLLYREHASGLAEVRGIALDGIGRWWISLRGIWAEHGAHEGQRRGRRHRGDDRISLSRSYFDRDFAGVARKFPLHLRIPGWTRDPSISVNGAKVEGARVEREWRRGDRVEIRLPMGVRAIPGFRGSISVERGPWSFRCALVRVGAG